MSECPLRILAFGAHPDDCDVKVGGCAALWSERGHRVCFISVTNGDAGHHEIGGAELAWRRRAEAEAAGAVVGIEYRVWDIHDGELVPSLENRRRVIAAIRGFAPDLVLTHRPNDYHPDHRYTSVLVQDASPMLRVPNVLPGTPPVEADPVMVYFSDTFQRPYPFAADVVVDIDAAAERKLDMHHCHTSQMYEWLPWCAGRLCEVPEGEAARRQWLGHRMARSSAAAERWRHLLVQRYGPKRGAAVRFAEAFEASEYGAPLTAEAATRLFPS